MEKVGARLPTPQFAEPSMLSPEQKDRIAELYECDMPVVEIAKQVGATESQVVYFVLADGLVRPNTRHRKVVGVTYMRNGRVVRPFTEEDDQRILALEASGATNGMIAKELNRRAHSIRQRIQTLARRENFEELAKPVRGDDD